MRARDVRAIIFCVVTTLALATALWIFTLNFVATLAATAAYAILLLTRPRMIRVIRRARGDTDWSDYFRN